MKLIIDESESPALTRWMDAAEPALLSSDLLRTEVLRATRRVAPWAIGRARKVLAALTLLTLPTSQFERAGELGPELLRSLDALHLAAALELGDALEAIITYDERLGAAAAHHGLAVIAPR